MSDLKVNGEEIWATADNLSKINREMKERFFEADYAVRCMSSFWSSQAGSHAAESFRKIKADGLEARYEIVDGFVKFLTNRVAAGYRTTEQHNKTLSEAFE